MKFRELSAFFKQTEETASRLSMTRILAELFKKADKDEARFISYLLQGRVVPLYEKQDFGIADRLVFKAFTQAFSLEGKHMRAELKKTGDIGLFIERYRAQAQTLFPKEKDLSVREVFYALNIMSKKQGSGSQEAKLRLIAELLEQLDPLSCRYLVRILVGKLRLGFSAITVLDAFSWMLKGDKSLRSEIEKAYNVRPDLGLVGSILKEKGISALRRVVPQVGVPILMARAERVGNPEEIIKKIGPCLIEPKYDGFRLQVHRAQDKTVKIFSRNMDDVSYMYPDIQHAAQKEIKAREFIIEGEAIGYNAKSGKYLPFQETVQRKRKYNIEQKSKEIPLRFFVFDLLYLNGTSYLNKEFAERKKALGKIVADTKTATIIPTHDELVDSAQRIVEIFQERVHEGLEGIMAKKLSGVYQAGARGFNWIKFKHSYASKLNDTIDCLVMGFDYGKGKRTAFGIGAFLVGVRDEKNDSFATVAKIGTGLSDEEWKTLRSSCDKRRVSEKPKEYVVDKMAEPDVWVVPFMIVEIKADEITRSSVHTAGRDKKGGLALRFPRLERFRKDKKPEDATTVAELQKMFMKQSTAAV